jgi:endonuclease/exonuclease/phosphatase family metal-dependent hydrolase
VTFYRPGTWSLGSAKFTPFRRHGNALRFWEGDGISRKGVLATVLTNNHNMSAVVVVNTHLQAQHGGRMYAQVRRDQVAEIESIVAPLTGRRDLMLLAGDFNTTPSDVLYAALLERWTDLTAGFRQVCEAEGRTRCGTSFAGKKTPEKWIDYVFVRRPCLCSVTAKVELIRNKQRDDPYSDHEGIQVDISSESRPSAVCALGYLFESVANPLQVTRRKLLSLLVKPAGSEGVRIRRSDGTLVRNPDQA